MRRIISLVLVLIITVSLAVQLKPMSYAETTHGYMLGDANDDGIISIKDVLLVRKYVARIADDKMIDKAAADVDLSGKIDMKDILIIRKAVARILTLDGVNTDGRYKVGTFSIGSRNISRFTIVLPHDSTPCMINAAKTLRNYIEEACGYLLSITYDESNVKGNKIIFSFDHDDEYSLGLEGYRVFVDEEGDLEVICGSLRGPIYAAYFMLEELVGYRFFTNNEVYLYANDDLKVSEFFDVTEIPGYSYRSAGGGGDYSVALRLNDSRQAQNAENGWRIGTLYIHAHSYAYQIAGYDHIYDEAYASQYHQTQPCLTDDETYEKIVDYNLKLLAEREGWGQHLGEVYTQISCSPNDNTNFCTCENCKNIYAIEGSIAGTVFRLSNRVIAAMREVYPEIELYTIAYWDARNPPKFTRPDDAICVCFCIGGCNNHTYDDTSPCEINGGNPRLQSPSGANSSNAEDMDFCRKWGELTNNLQIWYYGPNFCYYMAPSPNIMNLYNDFKYLYDIGATGMYSEGSGGGYTFEKLRSYLSAKMIWNPEMSEEEYNDLINEYLMFHFGPGWEYIREYLDMQTMAGDLQGCWTNNFDRPWDMYNEEYFKENYHYMAELFDKAYEKAENSTQRYYIDRARLHCDFLGLSATYERDYVNGSDSDRAAYKKTYQWLYNYIKNNNIKCASFDCQNFPENQDQIYDPMKWFFSDFTGHWEFKGDHWV